VATTKATELGQLGSKLTVHNENITLDGNVHGQYAGFDSDFTASIASVDTGSLSEGSNLYYTDARADARADVRAQLKIDALVGAAPGTLDTLQELGDALGDDPNFATTVTNSIAAKLPLAGGTLTGGLDVNSTARVLANNALFFMNTNNSASSYLKNTLGAGAADLRLGVLGDDKVTILSNGKVGIGTTDPSNNLTVDIAANNTGITLSDHGDGFFPQIIYNSNRSSAGQGLGKFSSQWNGTEVARIEFAAGTDATNKDDGAILFNTKESGASLTTKVKIETNGNVGIGDTLSVGGVTSSLKGYFYESTVNQNGSTKPSSVLGIAANIASRGEGPSLDFNTIWIGAEGYQQDNWNEGWTAGRIAGIYDATGLDTGALAFYTQTSGSTGGASSTSLTEKMRINAVGNVGIGTDSPSAPLTIGSGATRRGSYSDLLIAPGGDNAQIEMWGANTSFAISHFDNDRLGIYSNVSGSWGETRGINIKASNGNVGIGTTSPEVKLEVNGGADGSVVFAGRSDGGNGNNRRFNLIAYANGGGANYGGGLKIQTRSSTNVFADAITVQSNGRVGIGTTNPSSLLSVGEIPTHTPGSAFTSSPSAFYSTITLGTTTGDDQKIATFVGEDPSNVSGLAVYRYRRSNGTNWTTDGFSLRQEVDNTENIYSYMNFAGNNVGIGTASPSEKLHVEGSIRASGNIGVTQPDGDYLAKLYQTSADGFLELSTGEASPVVRTKLGAYGTNYIVPTGTTSTNQAMLSVGESIGAKTGVFNIRSTSSTVGGYRHRMNGGSDYKNVASMHTTSNSAQYWHIKTNIAYNQNVMFIARVHGYIYGNSGHILDVSRSGYAYSGSNAYVISSQTVNNGSYGYSFDTYYAASGANLCFRVNYIGSYYAGMAFDIKMQSPTGYNYDFAVIEHAANSVSGNHYT